MGTQATSNAKPVMVPAAYDAARTCSMVLDLSS
jgi:hypothetical protein